MEIAVAIVAVALVGIFIGTTAFRIVNRKKRKGGCGCGADCTSCPYCCGNKEKGQNNGENEANDNRYDKSDRKEIHHDEEV